MTYIENIFVCIAAPLLIAMICIDEKHRGVILYCLAGMCMCLLSAYLNTFIAKAYGADEFNASTQIAPVVEEIMKLLPMLFCIVIFGIKADRFRLGVLIVALSFATFENICYLAQNGASNLTFLLIRGFGTGAMHVVCGSVYSYWREFVWKSTKLQAACLLGLCCFAITYHATYNLLISSGKGLQIVAYIIPIFTVGFKWFLNTFIRQKKITA